MNLTITPAAEKFINRMIRFSGGPGYGFRLVVTPGGCSGLSSDFTVEKKPFDGDVTVDASGITLFMPLPSQMLLDGAVIDFSETPVSAGLVFITPNSPGESCSSSGNNANHHPAKVEISIDQIKRRQ